MNTKNKSPKKEPCNCDSCKEIRSLDRLDRVSRWVLGTVKWTYDFGYIFGSGKTFKGEWIKGKSVK